MLHSWSIRGFAIVYVGWDCWDVRIGLHDELRVQWREKMTYNMPVGSAKNPYDEEGFVCDYCNEKFDNDSDGEFVNDHMVCKDCLEYYCVKVGNKHITKADYYEQLREVIQIYFDLEREYFSEYHPMPFKRTEREKALEDIECLNMKIATFVENASYFYIPRHKATLKQLYYVIDYMFETELSDTELF